VEQSRNAEKIVKF